MSAVPRDTDALLTDAEREVWRAFVNGGWGLLAKITAAMSAQGMTQADLRVLEALGDSRTRGISELASTVHMTVSTVSRQISRMVADGSVERVECAEDARHRFVRITDQGLAALDKHVRVRDSLIRELVIEKLTDDEYRVIGEAFGKIEAGLAELPD
ncbi:MarR family transcriptional regulator [Gordonia sp. CPCC 206044]|uniref:MarR family winged helix-turn-helix transcriptional regulator n=1 Tax=Gordonia sp. CPCC 206044 TaxID=3140793 RepID=UPI003AF382C4